MSAPSIDRSYAAEDGDYESTGTLLDYKEEHPMTDELQRRADELAANECHH